MLPDANHRFRHSIFGLICCPTKNPTIHLNKAGSDERLKRLQYMRVLIFFKFDAVEFPDSGNL